MRLGIIAILLAVLAQKPVWAETVFFCEMTQYFRILQTQEIYDYPLVRFKMKVSETEGVTFSEKSVPLEPLQFGDEGYSSDTHWNVYGSTNAVTAHFRNGSFSWVVLGENAGPVAFVIFANCEDF